MRNISFLLALLLILGACSVSNNEPQWFSYPEWVSPISKDNDRKIFIATMNGLLAQTEPVEEEYQRQDGEMISILVGGKKIQSYQEIFASRFPNNLILLASGNHLSGEENLDQLKSTFELMGKLNFSAVSLDTKSFLALRTPGAQIEELDESKIPFMVSNFFDLKTQKQYRRKNATALRVVKRLGIKIAIISINHLGEEDKNLLVKKHQVLIQDPILGVLRLKNTKAFRQAHFRVALINMPTLCKGKIKNNTKSFSARDSHQLDCPSGDPLLRFVKRLPPKTIDLIISSNPAFAEGYLGEIAVMQNPGRGQFMSWMEIPFNPESKKIIREKIKILKPVKICHQFLLSRKDCHLIGDTQSIDDHPQGKEVIQAKFLGHEISAL